MGVMINGCEGYVMLSLVTMSMSVRQCLSHNLDAVCL